MGLWDTLRTAYNLAQRMEEVEHEWREVRSEWADTLDMVTRREERMRKRDQRALKGATVDDHPEVNGTVAPEDRKASIRQRAAAKGLGIAGRLQ
jgi:hypothetical protein